MNERTWNWVKIIGGILLGSGSLFALRHYDHAEGVMAVLPFVCLGIGCGAFGHGMGDLLSRKALASDPELARSLAIEQQDERNIALANRAKGKAFDIMIYVYGALLVSFGLMGMDLAPLLLLVFAYLLVMGCSIYYRIKYDKEM